jgi:hypothetical protein
MSKFLWIALIIFAAPVFVFAQSETKKFEQWQTFLSFGEEFSAEIPPSIFVKSKSGENRYYSAVIEGTYFFVFSDSLKNSFRVKKVLEFLKGYQAEKTVSAIGDFSADKFSFNDEEGFYHTILIVETKKRAYVFQTTSETENNSLVERFFANIQLNGSLEKNIAGAEDKDTKSIQDLPVQNSVIGYGSGTGSGNGNGIGNGEAMPLKSQTSANQTTSLQILSKPRADYTDWARFYQISGKIPLRVTFLADGNIGSVMAVKKLPFGLTNNAINAARTIRFQPAVKDGTAYTDTKLVEYSFMIY